MAEKWLKTRRRVWAAGQAVIVLGGIAAAVYWTQFAPIAITEHIVQRGEIIAEVMGTGTLDAHFSATISPKISGLVTEVAVDQGDRVQRGQVLIRLHDADLHRQVEVAEGSLGAAVAGVARQEAERTRALAVLDQARFDYDRVENLMKQNTASSTEYEDARKTLRVAEAEVARAEAALTEAQKQVIAAERTCEFQKARLADTIVSAPCDGLIARRDRDPGDVVVPGSSMLLVVATDEMWISAWVDETEMGRLAVSQPARVVFRSQPERAYSGEVARLGREVDREAREFLVDVRVRELPSNWAVGQRAEVYIETGRKTDAVRLPTRLIVWRDGRSGTFVEESARAAWRSVQLGLRGRELAEVTAGLNAGEQVITPANPQASSLKSGQRVVAESTSNGEGARVPP